MAPASWRLGYVMEVLALLDGARRTWEEFAKGLGCLVGPHGLDLGRVGLRRRRPPALEGDPERQPRHRHACRSYLIGIVREPTSTASQRRGRIEPPLLMPWQTAEAAMSYAVKEIFHTLQGEGAQAGRPPSSAASPAATSGPAARRTARARSAGSATPISSAWTAPAAAGSRTPRTLARPIEAAWATRSDGTGSSSSPAASRCCSSTAALLAALHAGASRSRSRPTARHRPGRDRLDLRQPQGRRAAAVAPRARAQAGLSRRTGSARRTFADLAFDHFWLQPMDGPERAEHAAAVAYCLAAPALAAQPADPQADRDPMKFTASIHASRRRHRLPKVPPTHKCQRMHGHSYRVELRLDGPVDPETGICGRFLRRRAGLRGRCWSASTTTRLNDIDGLENPTAGNIAAWIWHGVASRTAAIDRVRSSRRRLLGRVRRP